MLTNIDASKEKIAETSFTLYKIVSLDSYTEELKDPFQKGMPFKLGDSIYRPVEIITDGYESFIYSGSCAFADEEVCWDLVEVLNKQYHCLSGCFDVVSIEVEKGSRFYTGYNNSDMKSIKVYAVESFIVKEKSSYV